MSSIRLLNTVFPWLATGGFAPPESRNVRAWIREHALQRMIEDIGKGEDPGKNNHSRWLIEQVRANDGTPHAKRGYNDTDGAWCASVTSYEYMRALHDARIEFKRPELELGFKTSRSAKAFVEHIIYVGQEIDPMEARRGDVCLMKRPGGHHVFLVEYGVEEHPRLDTRFSGLLMSVEGNVGKVPAKVKRLRRDPKDVYRCGRYM